MATENTGVDGMSSISVSVGVVQLLKDRHGGIKPILDDLTKKHLIDVAFEGITLKLRGQCADILDIVVEYLHEIAGTVPVVTTAPIIRYTLGGKGRVAAILRGKYSELFQHLFDAEQQDLIKIKFMKKDQAKSDTITCSCKYSEYPTFKMKMKEIETKLKECNKTERTVKIEKKDQTRAKQFQKRSGNTTFYCFLRVGKKEDNNAEMVFYGRDENSCKDGISQCLSFVRGDTKHSNSVSPPKKTENAKEPSETTACNLPDKQNAPETMRSDWDTAESVTDTPSKATQKADGDRVTFATSSSSEQKPTTAKSDWSTATAATSLSSTKSLNLSKPKINNDLLSDKSKSASDSKHIISAVSASGVETDKTRSISYEERITPGKITGSGDAERYSFQICDMHVYVYKESITEIKGMDAVTNAANERMMHGGGVAFYISKAAGHKMNQDCNLYIQRNGLLQVTKNFVSVPGDMKCKGIIHAVGPTWYDYKDNEKDDFARDLYETVKNVLIAANSKKWKKVALSAISSGLSGVPKTLCAEMYIKAFADFATKTGGTVKEVHFIDEDREIRNIVIDTHRKWEKHPGKLDFKNAFGYKSTTLQRQTRKAVDVVLSECPVRMMGQDVENEVYVPEPPVPLCTIQVQGPTEIIKQTEILELYFDNERKSHGGNVQEVRYDLEEDLAYVTFETEEAAKRVVEKADHTVLKKHLSVQLFNPCKKTKQRYHYQVKAENTGEIQDPECSVKVNSGIRYSEFESLMSDEVKDDD